MAISTTPHTEREKNTDPAQDDVDPNQHNTDGSQGTDAAMYTDLEGAQTAGSRNERVTGYAGVKRNSEETTEAEYAAGRPATGTRPDAIGVTNHTVAEESASGQKKVMSERASTSIETGFDGNVIPPSSDPAITGDQPTRRADKAETVEVTTGKPSRPGEPKH